jgi:glycosyltransferase involved in cell wall biosynthesis
VCGDAAIFFNPYHVEEMRDTIRQFLKADSTLRSSLISKGFVNARRFSWEETAKTIIQLAQQ